MKQKKIYNGIDIVKLISAICIVLLHTIETTAWYPCEVKFVFTRFAVPFFFITSGFFFYKGLKKSDDKKKYFLHYEKHLIFLFIVWAVIIYAPVTLVTYAKQNLEIWEFLLVYFRRVFVIGPGPYWYLVAMILSAGFLYYCEKRSSDNLIIIGIIVGLALMIMYSCFQGVLGTITIFSWFFKAVYTVYSFEFNFIMYGIPFMGMGYLISKKEIKIKQSNALLGIVFFTILRIIEYNLPIIFSSEFFKNNTLSITFIGQAIFIFLFAKEWSINISRKTSELLRKFSTWVYLTHAIILYNIINPILERFTNLDTYGWEMIFPKVLVIIIICLILFMIIKKLDNKYLNKLIDG